MVLAGTGAAIAGTALLFPSGVAAADHPTAPPCTPTADACVDLRSQQAWLVEDGVPVRGPVPISSGGPGAETPVGTFVVEWKHIDHVSSEFGTPMPYSVFFAPGGIAFHEGPIDHPSAGCVRLTAENAAVFYEALVVGDEVQVH